MNPLTCWQCGSDISDTPRPISRHATCPQCFNELHCCRACQHFDPAQTLRCHEDRADPPLQKENANFCEFFNPHPNPYTSSTRTKASSSRDQLNALFGDRPTDEVDEDEAHHSDNTADPRKALDDLFKK